MEQRRIDPGEDPVCAMVVDPVEAGRSGLCFAYEGWDYLFCSTGCFLEFRDDPGWFLDPAYIPTLM